MERTIDLVCGMEVDPQTTNFKTSTPERTYYFCSNECKSRFDSHPQIYIQNNAEAKGA
jgi:Cu+-exporting ATPase